MPARYEYHIVEPRDRERIRCTAKQGECGRPASVCQHVLWDTGNTKGISFFYYCETCDPRLREGHNHDAA